MIRNRPLQWFSNFTYGLQIQFVLCFARLRYCSTRIYRTHPCIEKEPVCAVSSRNKRQSSAVLQLYFIICSFKHSPGDSQQLYCLKIMSDSRMKIVLQVRRKKHNPVLSFLKKPPNNCRSVAAFFLSLGRTSARCYTLYWERNKSHNKLPSECAGASSPSATAEPSSDILFSQGIIRSSSTRR